MTTNMDKINYGIPQSTSHARQMGYLFLSARIVAEIEANDE